MKPPRLSTRRSVRGQKALVIIGRCMLRQLDLKDLKSIEVSQSDHS
jgi:hypothetical protein